MDKRWKDIFNYTVIFILVFVIPTLTLQYFNRTDAGQFNKWANEDHEICVQRAKRDSVDKTWCDEIRSASKLTYNAVKSSSNTNMLLMYFQPLLLVLLLGMMNLRKQVEEIKRKMDD